MERILTWMTRLLTDDDPHRILARAVYPYSYGHASTRPAAAICELFEHGRRFPDFAPQPFRALQPAT